VFIVWFIFVREKSNRKVFEMPRPGAFGYRVKRKVVIVGDNVDGSSRKRAKLCGVKTTEQGEKGNNNCGMFLSPDASATGVNLNSFNSNDELDSLRMEEESGSNEMVIDDANACVSPDEVVEENSESNRATPTESESGDFQDTDNRRDGDADVAISVDDVDGKSRKLVNLSS
jgi:hypothetical protein